MDEETGLQLYYDGGEEELERAKLFSIIVKKEDVIVDENNQVIGYKYEKHNPQVKLKLRRNVAETLFQGQIHTFTFKGNFLFQRY